ncbi:DNA mismatch repair endonuclease MutL [Falcatimonas sp. MSJ-15]|uniref:DNA mismatch repair endonuclease MutL n=1 Tax=Falcatimonas sp. MSJ-15 TaxID=2841515 RepID=UPI001C106E0F|nr:DNA mismatch repair endonuclease MutL [Falcatimonas sp. MSJ-15]MBU5470823.1 DNA mismatch repair endonuclease MutL [Falcatimonas sp. MSJ-15]
MANIAVLDQTTINQIAAGEVIERPSSVVKELVENSIDAGATAITVEIKEGGISFIRITDNGSGIEEKELPLAFLRHSTSKIKSAIDLMSVKSLGFRGEALSSIAAVAQVELITKTKEAFTGARYVIEGGKEVSIESIGAPCGTTFIVRNLFFNTPARRKFLKTPATEAGYISELIERLAISHPDISFRFINNNQPKLHTSGNTNVKDIIYHIYGRDIAANVINVSAAEEGISVSGFIGKPVVTRGNRNYENYFINGRYVKSNIISKAIEEAYQPYIMQHRYPFTALHFTIKSDTLDINVHPTKMELRFSNNQQVYNFVLNTLSHALSHREMIPDVVIDDKENEKSIQIEKKAINSTRMPEPFENRRLSFNTANNSYISNSIGNATVKKEMNNSLDNKNTSDSINMQKNSSINIQENGSGNIQEQLIREENAPYKSKNVEEQAGNMQNSNMPVKSEDVSVHTVTGVTENVSANKETDAGLVAENGNETNKIVISEKIPEKEQYEQLKFLDEKAMISHRIIGQLFDTYWLVEYGKNLYMIDQHAAHEKVLYERMMKRLKEDGRCESQYISPPIVLSLSMREEEVLKENMELFKNLGYEIEPFGGKEYSISAVPSNIPGVADSELLIEVLDGLVEDNKKGEADVIREKIASMSCKAAVKGNNRLSLDEIKTLIDELLSLDNPYNCPHGRPTIISMSKYEIERKFKRIV